MNEQIKKDTAAVKHTVPWYGYVTLLFTLLFLSGLFKDATGPLACLDFTNVLGAFGKAGTVTDGAAAVKFASDFRGTGGSGARDGFMLALTVGPAVILAFGIIEIYNNFKGMEAAQKLFTPILKPLLGLPGSTAVGLVSSFTSADAGAGVAKSMTTEGQLTKNQNLIMTCFMFSSPAILVNFFALANSLFEYLTVPMILPLVVIIVMKFVGAILCRIYLSVTSKKEAA